MNNYFLAFNDDVIEDCARLIEQTAPAIWGEAQADLGCVRITAGNVAAYGRYIGKCYPSGLIELPTGNGFSVLKIDHGRVGYGNPDEKTRFLLWGTLLHELGHHVVNHAKAKPWAKLKAGYSTHLTPAWCWIAATGWKYFHPEWKGGPETLAAMVRLGSSNNDELKTSIGKKLAGFDPYLEPPAVGSGITDFDQPNCVVCGVCFEPKRSDAHYCSARCRKVAWKQRQERIGA